MASFSLFAAASLLLALQAPAATPAPPPGLQRVDDDPVLAKQIDAIVPDVVATYGDGQQVKGAEIRAQVKQMFAAVPKGANSAMSDEQVRQMVRGMAERIVDQAMRREAAAHDGFKPNLETAKVQLDAMLARTPKLPEQLKQQGWTTDDLLRMLAEGEAMRQWIDTKLLPEVATEAELQKYYDEHRDELETRQVSQILAIPKKDPQTGEVTDATRTEAKQRIAAAQARLQAGEEFAKVAKECSDCPSAKDGGDLGTYTRNNSPFPPEFTDAAFALKDKETSGIVETHYGYHLVKVSGIPATLPAESRNRILQTQFRARVQKLIETKVEEQKKNANLKFNL